MTIATPNEWRDWLWFLSQETETALWKFDIASQRPEFISRDYYLGYQPGEVEASFEAWISLMHPDERQVIEERLREIMDGRIEHLHFEHRGRHRNGAWHWMRTSVVIQKWDDEGLPTELLGATMEITHPRHVERLLHLGRTILQQMSRPVPLPQLLERLVNVMRDVVGKGWAAVVLGDDDAGPWKLAADTNLPNPYRRLLTAEDHCDCEKDCVCAWIAQGAAQDGICEPWCERCRPVANESGIRACNAHPLIGANGEPLGSLILFFPDQQLPTREEHEVLTISAQMAVVAIEHWRNQESLRASQERFRLLAETVRVVPWEWSPHSRRYTYIGPQAEQVFGYPLNDWLTPGFWENSIHPEQLKDILAKCEREVKVKDNYLLEYRFKRANDEWLWVHDIVTVQRDAGKPVMLRGFMVDITTLRAIQDSLAQSESRLRSITDCAPDFIMQIDRVHRIQFINHVDPTLGAVEAIGTTVESWLPDSDRPNCFKNIELAFLTGKVQQYETRYHAPSGETHYFWTRVGPIKLNGKVESAVLIAHDVTALRHAEQAVRERDSRLAHAERLTTMGQMATELAHEINQPLYAIANFADACMGSLHQLDGIDDVDLTDLKKWLVQIGTQSRRASEIVQRINHFVRKEEAERTIFSVNEAVNNIVPLFEFAMRRDDIQLELDLTPNLPKVCADRLLIEQILTNLVRNATEALRDSKTENGRVLVRTFRLRSDQIAVSVIDNGPGISPAIQDTLFEPFFSTKTDGTGMGLAICRTAIESHGGQIWGVNHPGGGARFEFTLPIREPQ